jgi:RimJ/RimL family protein N-acetyltransferase
MTITIERWSPDDLGLLIRCNAPELMTELGGPETDEKVLVRHKKYLRGWETGDAHMFRIELDGEGVGGIGYWPTEWNDQEVFETGWTVVGEHHGKGVATAALALLVQRARADGSRRYLHALPKVSNGPSNAVCRKAGFTLCGEVDDEYPPGNPIVSNDWVLDLQETQPK